MRGGFVDALPFAPSVTALGVVFGASTATVGLSPLAAVLMSGVVWSGAGQFAALPLWPQGGTIVILSTLALSLRFALVTTSMAPLLAKRSVWLRLVLAYALERRLAHEIVRGPAAKMGFDHNLGRDPAHILAAHRCTSAARSAFGQPPFRSCDPN